MDLARVDNFMAALLEVLVISDQIIRHPAIDLIYGETFNLFLRKSRILQINLRNTLEVLFNMWLENFLHLLDEDESVGAPLKVKRLVILDRLRSEVF